MSNYLDGGTGVDTREALYANIQSLFTLGGVANDERYEIERRVV